MSEDLRAEVCELRRRVAALESMVFRKCAHRQSVLKILEAWPGPFTVHQIEQTLAQLEPQTAAELKPYFVGQTIGRLEKSGHVTRLSQAAGQTGAVYQFLQKPIEPHRGPRFNRTAPYESGFRGIVRRALYDLPAEFTLADLRGWMDKNMPGVQIPYGSWSSTLYKLTESEELICVKGRGSICSARRKTWKKGPRRVLPSGDELVELAAAWAEFREAMKIPTPSAEWSDGLLSPLQRGENRP